MKFCSCCACPSHSACARANYRFDSRHAYSKEHFSSSQQHKCQFPTPVQWTDTKKAQTPCDHLQAWEAIKRVKLGSADYRTRLLAPVCLQIPSFQRYYLNFGTGQQWTCSLKCKVCLQKALWRQFYQRKASQAFAAVTFLFPRKMVGWGLSTTSDTWTVS